MRKKELCGDTLANFNEDSQQIKHLDIWSAENTTSMGFCVHCDCFRANNVPKCPAVGPQPEVSPWAVGQRQAVGLGRPGVLGPRGLGALGGRLEGREEGGGGVLKNGRIGRRHVLSVDLFVEKLNNYNWNLISSD